MAHFCHNIIFSTSHEAGARHTLVSSVIGYGTSRTNKKPQDLVEAMRIQGIFHGAVFYEHRQRSKKNWEEQNVALPWNQQKWRALMRHIPGLIF